MSENKYIIDKDSLTGIADAVRDKLGNGAAITDEDAGYYPVPVKKLGYSETASTASYSGPGSGYADNTIYVRPILELENICGIRPSYIKVTVTNSSGFKNNDIIFRYTNINSPSSTRVDSAGFDAKHTAILSIPNDIENCYIAYGGYYSSYSSQYSHRSIPAYDVVFLDSNQNEIDISEYSGDSFVVNQWGTTKTFLTGTSFEKIPYSIDDIQNKISNYLTSNTGGGGTLETWKLSNTSGTYLTFPSGFSIENLKDITCGSNGYARGLYKDSLGKPASMKDQGISLPSSFSTIGSPLTVAKISTAHNEGRTFCIPWNWTGVKTIPDDTYFVWFVVEPNDSKIYLGIGRYANYVSNGNWTVIYT